MDKELLAVAGGSKPADVVISNGRIVNVYTGEIYDGGVAISGQTIAAVGDVDYCIGEGTKTIDAEGAFITRNKQDKWDCASITYGSCTYFTYMYISA